MNPAEIPFLDLSRQNEELAGEFAAAFSRFMQEGNFILGPEVASLEEEFTAYCGATAGVGVASGTDALLLSLKALGIEPGDEVITAALSAPPTAVAISLAGAQPVFADIDPVSRCLSPHALREKVSGRTRCAVVVHLYGRMADMPEIAGIAEECGLALIEDCAQAHGASLLGRAAGTWGQAGCYSFYPTKNLGAYGDGGMVVTGDDDLASHLRSLRDYGRTDRDRLGEIGFNSRLDELQAAFLRIKLVRLEAWNRRRRELARRYLEGLAGLPLGLPDWDGERNHCFHLFVVEYEERDDLRIHLAKRGIQTAVHYPVPLHLQEPYLAGGLPSCSCPAAERTARRVLSLPLYPHLSDEEQDRIIEAIISFFRALA